MPAPKMVSKPPTVDSAELVRIAQAKVVTARDRVAAAIASQRTARATLATALNAWQSELPKVTHETLVREGAKRDAERVLALRSGEIAPPKPVQYQSVLDEVFAATGKGSTINRGNRRPAPRLPR